MDNHWPRQLTAGYIVAGIVQQNLISSRGCMPKLRHASSNRRMPCLVYAFEPLQWTWDQADKNPGVCFRCLADIFLNITYHEIQQPGMLIARKISQVSIVLCTNDWHNHRFSRKLILGIPQPIVRIHLAVDSMNLRVSEAHRFKILVCLKSQLC